jgi:acyl-CoA synthetase (AMP-forming)/AMP-acid ligase II
MALPPFHIFGVVTQLYLPIAYLVTAVVYPPRTRNDPLALPVIPTSDNVIEQLKKIECNVFMTVPTFLEQIATSDELIEVVKKIDSIVRAIYCDLPSLRLSICRFMPVALSLSRSVRSCGMLGCISPAVMVGQSSESPWHWLKSKISPTVIGCGCVSQKTRNSGGYHREMIHTSCRFWYEIFTPR